MASRSPIGVASNGAQALEVLRDKKVDLILADFMMPEVNGIELTRLVKSKPQWFETKILLFSCNADPEYRQRALELGAIDYIPKTQGANAIVKRVYEILQLEPAPEEPETDAPSPPSVQRPSMQKQLLSLSQSLLDILHLAGMPQDLPQTTKYALDSARRVASDIRDVAGAAAEEPEPAETPDTRALAGKSD